MRFVLLLGLAICLISSVSAKQKKHHKKNDWDGLENLLRKVDQIDKKLEAESAELATLEEEEEAEDEEDDDTPALTTTPPPQTNPCEDHHCGWGKECIVNKAGNPKCDCIRECPNIPDPDPFDKVCSNQNETFDSICHLYRERCICRKDKASCQNDQHKKTHLEYMGECKGLETCTQELLDQFPARMADWLFQVMRDLKKRQELNGDDWIDMIEEAEHDDHLKHVYPIIWKFCDLDKSHDKEVTHHELIPITAPVIPMESCIKPFLKTCDVDNDEKISLKEWGKCLGLKEGEIIERC